MAYAQLLDSAIDLLACRPEEMADNSSPFTFSMMFEKDDSSLPYFLHVKGVGDIPVPISPQCVGRLKESAAETLFGYGLHVENNPLLRKSWTIDGPLIYIPSPPDVTAQNAHSWMELALKRSNIDVDAIGAEVIFNEMILYQPGGHYIRHRILAEEAGHFATMTLYIPTEGGHKGGRIIVDHHHRTEELDLSLYSHQNFYMSVVHVNSEIEMEPILTGNRVELVFHMMWKEPAIKLYPRPPYISTFLVALTKVRRDLKSWIEHTDKDGLAKMLVIGLQHNYDPVSHSFTKLEGQDRSVAHLIRSTFLIEVHLAQLTRQVTGSGRTDILKPRVGSKKVEIKEVHRTVHKASYWIGVDNCAAQFQGINMDTQSEFVGSVFKDGAKPDREEMVEHPDFSGATVNLWYHQSVLILWPKSKSFHYDLRHRFDHLLYRMEWEPVDKALELLKSIVSMLRICNLTGLRICSLLNICLRCKAVPQALDLLGVMVKESIGIASNDIANVIAEIGSKLIEWPMFKDYLSQLITCKPGKQLIHLAALSVALLESNASDGFAMVSKYTWKTFMYNARTPAKIDRQTSAACVRMAIRMEERAVTSDPDRMDEFFVCFKQWQVVQKCHLVIDIQNMVEKSTGQDLFLRLCHHIVHVVEPTDKSLEDCVIDFIHCLLLDKNETQVLAMFVNKLCERPKNPGDEKHLLRKLVSSLEAIDDDVPVDVIKQLLNARIDELQSYEMPDIDLEFRDAKFEDEDEYPDVVEFLKSQKTIMTKSGFKSKNDAKRFESKYFGVMDNCIQRGYSAMTEVLGNGKSLRVKIVKCRNLYFNRKAKYQASKQELTRLLKLRISLGFQTESAVENDSDDSESSYRQDAKKRRTE